MKKGFTLIELLAVILILGIIALIAIPTVNNIISEARYGAFKSGNENIMREVEQACQTNLMKGESPILTYNFEDGKSNYNINAKGSLPKDGFILLDKNCTITDYYLTDGKNEYTNGDDLRKDYMLKSYSEENASIFKTMYLDYFGKIVSINIIKNLDIPENAIEIKDPSVSEKGKIKSWLVPNGENYDLYVGSLNKIFANYDSSYLFSDLLISSINLDNFYIDFSISLNSLFKNCKNLENIDVSKFNTSNVTSISNIFNNCVKIKVLNVSNWYTEKFKDCSGMFATCHALQMLDVSKWRLPNLTSLRSSFWECMVLQNLDLSNWNVSNTLIDMEHTFVRCHNLTFLDLSSFDTSNLNNLIATFAGCGKLREIKGIDMWNTSNLVKVYNNGLSGTFDDCVSLEKLDLHNWDISKIENFGYLISDCISLKYLDISTWNLDNNLNYTNMISNCRNLKELKMYNDISANLLIDQLSSKNVDDPGLLTIVGERTNLNYSSLSNKNWNVI